VPPLDELTNRLRSLADPAKKMWWERYLKGEIEFLGVPMADIRTAIHAWVDSAGMDADEAREAALALLRRPLAEEKLAGILLLQERVAPAGALLPTRDLPVIARLFDDGHIWEWSTTDWLCVRVIGPMVAAGGRPVAAMVAGWVAAPGLWRRRAAVVAFVPVAGGGETTAPWLVDTVLEVCAATVSDRARFAQTAIGWVLRELSGPAPDRTHGFVLAHRASMSREATRMAARLDDELRASLGVTGKRSRR